VTKGNIACANVLSDLYAMGVVDCDNMLMLLGVSTDMTQREKDVVTTLIIQGFHDLAKEAGTTTTGGQTVLNPWPIIGGVAMSTVKHSDFILPENAKIGDVLVLTKPLGTQVVVNIHQWLDRPERWDQIKHLVTTEQAESIYEFAMYQMARLNRNAARLMHKYGAHAATDVTGFGIMGHANNLARNQTLKNIAFELTALPLIHKTTEVAAVFPFFRLLEGLSAETSGGLLIALPPENVHAFCRELEQLDGYPVYAVGHVVVKPEDKINEENYAYILPNFPIIDVIPPSFPNEA